MKNNQPNIGGHKAGFTLIELLAVVAIIALLGGVGVSGFNAYKRSATAQQATTQLRVLENGIETFFGDRGHYPVLRFTPESPDFGRGKYGGRGVTPFAYPRAARALNGDLSTQALIWCLGGQSIRLDALTATPILPSLGLPGTSKTTMVDSKRQKIIDAYGNSFSYKPAPANWERSNAGRDGTINPTFDLWSPGPDGVEGSGDINKDGVPDSQDDITNW